MRALVQAEVLKLRTRTAAWLLLATLAMDALTIVVIVPKADDLDAPVSLHDPGLLAATVGTGFDWPAVLVVLLGALAFTQEFRYGTVTSTYLVEPRRARVLVAKLLTLAIVSVMITIATLALTVPLGIAIIRSRDGAATLSTQFWQTVAAGLVVMVAYSVIGVAIGVLLRNQIIAAVGVLVWMTAIEWTVIPNFPAAGRWMPTGATSSFMQLAPSLGLDGKLLSASAGGLVLLGYTALAVTLAVRLTPRRDVL
jgi:ABC-2 type transport system permease protein